MAAGGAPVYYTEWEPPASVSAAGNARGRKREGKHARGRRKGGKADDSEHAEKDSGVQSQEGENTTRHGRKPPERQSTRRDGCIGVEEHAVSTGGRRRRMTPDQAARCAGSAQSNPQRPERNEKGRRKV